MIGERINPTGRKLLAAEMKEGNYDRVVADALAQVAAGAQMLDVNAGIPLADEPRILAECIQLVQNTVDVPLSIDSSIVAALEAGQADIKVKLDELHDMVKTLMPNGKNTNNTGDLNYRIAEKLGVVLPEEPDGHA